MALSRQSCSMLGVCMFVFAFVSEVMSDTACNVDVDKVLETLLDPDTDPSIQLKALRSSLLRKLQEALEKLEEENEERQHILATLSRWNNLPENKRNLESLARAGYIKTLPDEEEEEDANYKRSIANMAKNGQLPIRQENQKRGIGSLARNGDYHIRGDIRNPFSDQTIRSLRGEKRSLSSLAKAGDLRYKEMPPKKNLVSLVREGLYPGPRFGGQFYSRNGAGDFSGGSTEKRNLQALKAQYKPQYKRSTTSGNKRQVDYETEEYPSLYQNIYDYDDMGQDIDTFYPVEDKRFLGRLPQMGKPKSTLAPKINRYH